jgi:hypothetical protein
MESVLSASADHRRAARRYEVERVVAAGVVLLCFATIPVYVGRLSITTIAVLALAPVWVGALRRFRGASLLLLAVLLALATGSVMALLATPERQVAWEGGIEFAALAVTLIGRVGVLLWARTRLSTPVVAVLAGTAMLATVSRDSSLYATNPWKFGFAVPVAVLALAVAWWLGRRWLEIVIALVLAALSATNDARSSSAILGLTLLVVGWQVLRPDAESSPGRSRWVGTAFVVAGFAWSVYHLVEELILSGFLGESTQQRTRMQLDAGGSLLAGGRPELGATLGLMREAPWGFGLGVLPSLHDVMVAKSGMASINYDPDNGYVENYMLGGGFALHSVVGDLWANLGWGGLALCAVLVFVAFRAVLMRVRIGRASALVVFLACNAAWALPFGPFRSSATELALCVGLALIPLVPRRGESGWDEAVESPRDG